MRCIQICGWLGACSKGLITFSCESTFGGAGGGVLPGLRETWVGSVITLSVPQSVSHGPGGSGHVLAKMDSELHRKDFPVYVPPGMGDWGRKPSGYSPTSGP